jgi:hypothetical protein
MISRMKMKFLLYKLDPGFLCFLRVSAPLLLLSQSPRLGLIEIAPLFHLLVRKPEKAQLIHPPITIMGNTLVKLPFIISVIMEGSAMREIKCGKMGHQMH